jgi:hypothetical protein
MAGDAISGKRAGGVGQSSIVEQRQQRGLYDRPRWGAFPQG